MDIEELVAQIAQVAKKVSVAEKGLRRENKSLNELKQQWVIATYGELVGRTV
jgi:hypothetical protein